MRKVFVSTLVLSMSMGIMYDVSAQRNRASVITSRTARAGNRGGSSSSSSSQSSSSTTNVDITTTTQRFKNNKYDFDSKLYYDKEYELRDFLTSATYNYYYNNGSNSINEQLCFGPYMFVNKNTNNTNYMDYIGVEKSEAKRTCIDIMPNMTYTLGLIPASDSAVETASAEGRYLTIQNNNFPSRDIKKLLSTEKYVDVSEYAKSITDTFNNVKSYCGNYNENMDSIRKQLGAVLGTSLGGTGLSAGATAVNVLNVKKTEETGKKIASNEETKKEITRIEGLYGISGGKINGEIIDNVITLAEKDKKQVEDCIASRGKIDGNKLEEFILKYKAKKTYMIGKAFFVGKAFAMIDGKCDNEDKNNIKNLKLDEFCNNMEDRKKNILEWKNTIKNSKDEKENWCGNNWTVDTKDENKSHNCMASFLYNYASQQYGNDLEIKYLDDLTLDKVKEKLNDKVLSANIDEKPTESELISLLNSAVTSEGEGDCPNEDQTLDELETKIADLKTYQSLQNSQDDNNKKIDANNESSRKMDVANVWLSGASTLTSGVSVVFSSTALARVKEALENLEKCQKSLTELKTIFAEYNAEIEAEEGE